MSTTTAIKLVDGNGSVLIATRIDDLAITFAFQPAQDEDGEFMPFRMFEDDRAKLHEFMRGLLRG